MQRGQRGVLRQLRRGAAAPGDGRQVGRRSVAGQDSERHADGGGQRVGSLQRKIPHQCPEKNLKIQTQQKHGKTNAKTLILPQGHQRQNL